MRYVLRTDEAAKKLGVDIETMLYWAEEGLIESRQLHGTWFFPTRAVMAKKQQMVRRRPMQVAVLRADEAAVELGVDINTLSYWAEAELIEAGRLYGAWFFPARAVMAKKRQLARPRRLSKPADVFRADEAAKMLGVNVSTMHRWARERKIEAEQLYGFWFFTKQAVTTKQRQMASESRKREVLLAKETVAGYFWVTTQTVRCWTKAGLLKPVRVSRGQALYREEPILRLLKRHGYDLTNLTAPRVNTATAARVLGMSDGSVLRFVRNGDLEAAYTLWGHARILAADVENLRLRRAQ